MNRTIQIAPVRKTVVVKAEAQRAFEVFTAGIDRWWPKSHGIGNGPVLRSAIEPRVGGRWYAQYGDGSEISNGHVRVWEPPSRVVFSWEISAEWKPEPDASVASEIEVRFIAEGPGLTRVEVEHRDFELMGAEGGEKMRKGVDGGWPGLLQLYAQQVSAELAA
jgi:uncharacterized protein YndB with AHSA1/START domain